MTLQGIVFIAGAVFILIAIIGGGFTIKDLKFPAVPKSGRIGSGIVGVIFIFYAFLMSPTSTNLPPRDPRLPPSSGSPAMPILHEEDQPYESNRGDGIEVSKLIARGEHEPLQLDDLITVQYTLQNIGEIPITLEYIFVGGLDPEKDKYNLPGLGEFEVNETLQPGEEYSFEKSSTLPETGVWTLFPCYRTAGAPPLEGYCPDLWRSFPVKVVQ